MSGHWLEALATRTGRFNDLRTTTRRCSGIVSLPVCWYVYKVAGAQHKEEGMPRMNIYVESSNKCFTICLHQAWSMCFVVIGVLYRTHDTEIRS